MTKRIRKNRRKEEAMESLLNACEFPEIDLPIPDIKPEVPIFDFSPLLMDLFIDIPKMDCNFKNIDLFNFDFQNNSRLKHRTSKKRKNRLHPIRQA